MAIFKCKMCGGDLDVTEGVNIVECEYCGTKQTVPYADNEKKVNLFNRANRLRLGGEFDKAAGIYENIIAEFPEEAEAYWGLCLCNYGIEYVDDPLTARKIPTCHRASFESLQKDENFNLALEYADVVAQKVYRDEAREIDRIMSEILAVSKNEKPYDVFICYKETDEMGERTVDSVLAHDIYDALTAKGLKVFFARITLEDKLGRQYEPYIFAALNSAKVMLSVGTRYEYFHAVWVKNEWSRFLKLMAKDKSKVLIPCFKDIDAYDMPEEFKGLQAQDMGKLGAVQDLVRGIEKIIGKDNDRVHQVVAEGIDVKMVLKRGYVAIEDKEWDEAGKFFDLVLNHDAENAEAYLGMAFVDKKVTSLKEFVFTKDLQNRSYLRAKKYAGADLLNIINALEFEQKEEETRKEERLKKGFLLSRKMRNYISIDFSSVVGLDSDGSVTAVDLDYDIQKEIYEWTDVCAVFSKYKRIYAIREDGTVVCTGEDVFDEDQICEWKDIVDIGVGESHTVALKKDGTVVATKEHDNLFFFDDDGFDVSDWRNIIDVDAGYDYIIGLKSDGTVVAEGERYVEKCISEWRDIVSISAGPYGAAAGLKSNGTVLVTEEFKGVSSWRDIISVSVGNDHIVGLKVDGTVVAAGENDKGQCNVSDWNDIIAVSAGYDCTVGLRSDGTMVYAGDSGYTEWQISESKLFL